MMKVIGKLGVYVVLGGVFGYFFAMFAMDRESTLDFSGLAFPFVIALLVVVIGLLAFSLFGYMKIRKLSEQTFKGDEEDRMEERMYRLYADASLAGAVAIVASLTGMAAAILTEAAVWTVFVFAALLLLGTVLSFFFPTLMNVMYPERNLPAMSDKDYTKKLLAHSDDGERHIMLGGLFKSYQTANSLMFLAILFLLFYSLATGTSQMVGILVLAIIIISTNTRYSLSIRNK
ncbi:DUF3169 family protein [Chryseomicrobium palamuruense]|uniref:DUF3169 family protein n=1 Tax=Chryseomicrobium palamuruense TaxID=682973 RepID=A0ABV8UTX5_9BACL